MIIICFFRIFFRTFDIFQLKGFGPNFEKCRTPLVCILIWTLVLQKIIKFNRIYFYQKSLFSKLKLIFSKSEIDFFKNWNIVLKCTLYWESSDAAPPSPPPSPDPIQSKPGMLATKRRPTQHVSSFFLNLENFNDHVTFMRKWLGQLIIVWSSESAKTRGIKFSKLNWVEHYKRLSNRIIFSDCVIKY